MAQRQRPQTMGEIGERERCMDVWIHASMSGYMMDTCDEGCGQGEMAMGDTVSERARMRMFM